jgi:hypothetical protein
MRGEIKHLIPYLPPTPPEEQSARNPLKVAIIMLLTFFNTFFVEA